ncbi:MAG: ABC transporter ATP-binding protein [Proteobacteria bacterium]|nr:ABC transporter ATP-binding protein [Pseudomonadota bacterium]
MAEPRETLLRLHALGVAYRRDGRELHAVDGVDLELRERECLGVVGESGSGKSQLLLALLGLSAPGARLSGSIRYRGEELVGAPAARLEAIRGRRIAIVFQDPLSALNPYLTIGTQLTEGARRQLRLGRRAAASRAAELLATVQIDAPTERLRCHPHELSGGMRQRVLIAMALMCEPEILLLDEPTTALDVTVQAQVLQLLRDLRERSGVASLFVTHDLGALASMADRVAVMYGGRLVELASAAALYAAPLHPYTAGLLRSLPRLDLPLPARLPSIPGQPPDLAELPAGCAFAPRCPLVHERCTRQPDLRVLPDGRANACHFTGSATQVDAAWIRA